MTDELASLREQNGSNQTPKWRSRLGMASAIAAFFIAYLLWMLAFAAIGWAPMEEKDISNADLALNLSGMAFGLGAGYFVGNLVEGKPLRELNRRVFGPLRSVLSWLLVGGGLVLLLVFGYYMFQGIAALPVSIAIVFGAMIIASAIRK